MNNKALTLSLLMAILAVFFVQSYVSSIEEEAKKKFGTEILVVKAKKDIKEAETIDETALELARIPKRFKEPAAISFEQREEDKEVLRSMKRLTGAIAIVPIKKGEQITLNKITEPGVRTGLAPQVAPGRRAIAVPVTEISGVAKLVKPGDRVDLIAVIDTGLGKEYRLSKTVLQDIVVLAVGRSVTNNVARVVETDMFGGKDRIKSLAEDFSFNSVTVEVEPSQAQALALVLANGDNALTLSLRNNDDTDRVNVGATTIYDVLGPDAMHLQRTPAGKK
ncbi:MAG: Flp pilus assembly protein CpaB [Bdellovibrionales bacterium RIFOXYC1_FULL_54_43]|nr:MAG: Flp pilus assembly protein CpaB [Bdellovibrionales bacterium RIFOXYC1_FULL_54_43]OFZ79207.1 MAG: Flp pilus assembly protein CpaB [Bdellovibrionales bacterium RIFOXYD1_FULL_55_31]